MPKNKDAYSRYKIIDQYLRRHSFAKSRRLSEVCSEKLGIPISQRTIQKDISDLRDDSVLQIYAPIEYSSSQKAYYYPENVNEIFPALELDEEEISALLFYGKIIGQYNSYGIFNEITMAIEKVLDASNIKSTYKKLFNNHPLILTERNPPLRGSELILKIIQALKHQKKIQFDYQKFDTENKKERIISPYLLKEDKHMWYVIGFYETKNRIQTFAVDRMSHVRIVDQSIVKADFTPSEHFKYSFGVTVSEGQPIEVVLSFTKHQGNYIKALPIHETQRIITDNEKELQIAVTVKPSYEFYSKILSYGPDIRVISPKEVRNKVNDLLRKSLDNYN